MVDFCAAEEYLCLDATEMLTAAADAGQQLYNAQDNHLNAAGNAVLAGIVWEFLIRKLNGRAIKQYLPLDTAAPFLGVEAVETAVQGNGRF